MGKYCYKVYGMNIKSDIEIDELLKVNNFSENEDIINITMGRMPREVQRLHKQGKFVAPSFQKVYLYIPGIATYCIENGKKIIIEPYYKADMKMVNIYFIGCVLGILMHQRKVVAIHGATVVNNNKAIIITGDCGAGKSTLSTELRKRGYGFISDDVAAIKFNNKPFVMHGFPFQKICEDTMSKLGYDKKLYTSFQSDDKVKYLVSVENKFITKDTVLTTMVEVTVGDVDSVRYEKINGHDKLEKVLYNLFSKSYIKPCGGVTKEYFKECAEIAKNIDIYRITRPYGKFTVDEQIQLIEKLI